MSALDIKAQELRGQLQSLGRALELAPQDVTLMRRFAEVLRELGARREALALYARAVELDPGSAERLCELGALHAELRHHEEAASAYAAALALRPDHVAAQVGKAALLRLRGLPREAETVCRAALAVAPDDVDAWTLLGELCADGGRFGEAEDCFRQALRVQPESCGALIGIATHRKMTAADAGWRRRVEALLARALPLRHEIGLRYALGKYCDDVGEYGAAFAQYAAANELGKRQTPAYDGAKFSRRRCRCDRACPRAGLALRATGIRGRHAPFRNLSARTDSGLPPRHRRRRRAGVLGRGVHSAAKVRSRP
jgi:tetratricopeptide (TPR) repeat protein